MTQALRESFDGLKGERRLLGLGIIALTLIVTILMAWRLPLRRNVEDPEVWGILRQEYYENYAPSEAPPEAPTAASPKPARGTEDEHSGTASSAAGSPVSGPPPEEATPEPSVIGSSDANSSSAAKKPEGSAAAMATSAPGRERLRRVRHLRRIRQRRPPRRTW